MTLRKRPCPLFLRGVCDCDYRPGSCSGSQRLRQLFATPAYRPGVASSCRGSLVSIESSGSFLEGSMWDQALHWDAIAVAVSRNVGRLWLLGHVARRLSSDPR